MIMQHFKMYFWLLHEWSVRWQLKCNISKYKHVHFGPVHQFGSYYLNGIKIDYVKSQKDLGIFFDHQLKFHLHTTDVAAKANRLLGLIRKSFNYLDLDMLVKLFVTVCSPSYFGTLQFSMGAISYLFLIKGKSKRFNVELQDYYH